MVTKPEVLAPAGDAESLHVALEAGADAVYFGLDEGFNARARASNFPVHQLAEVVGKIHRAGARAYLALNTLVFQSELEVVEPLLREAARAGVDALIVQDPGLALLARAVCPEMELHASTQMTLSSPEAARFAETLGVTRIVAPRELSVEQIRRLAAGTDLEIEVFVLGALCMAWSGQCLSSEAWGGRSANRGQCAQACRLPYDLVVDGRRRDLGDVAYLLSPKDLAGFGSLQALVEAGVHTLKIEGRQKGPVYVRTATASMRRWVDGILAGRPDEGQLSSDVRDLTLAYSRGFSEGFLAGTDHQTLVDGRFPRHRGLFVGRVVSVEGDRVRLDGLAVEVRPGMGVVFDQGRPEEAEEGGPVFAVERTALAFGRPGPDLRRVRPGDRVWLTGDPELQARVQRALRTEPAGRIPLHLQLSGREGQPLRLQASGATVRTRSVLEKARGGGLSAATLEEKLGAFGGTPYRLASLEVDLPAGLFVPPSELKALRRDLVAALQRPRVRAVAEEPQVGRLRQAMQVAPARAETELVALCRTPDQLEAAVAAGVAEVELDWMEFVGLGKAVQRAREAGLRVVLATVRVQKPGEEVYDRRIEALKPDAVLVRHWAGVMHFSERPGAVVHGDFSLNVTNALTAFHLLGLGLTTLTASHDLDERQLMALLDEVPAARMAVTVHHHIPTFHTEHCVYAHLLSEGRDYRTCGRPCEEHRVSLRDRVGNEHPVIVDVECRNTVFNAAAQSAAFLVPRLVERGVRRLRVEFVRETREEACAVLDAYRRLLAGEASPPEVVQALRVHEQFGVTRGTMQVLR